MGVDLNSLTQTLDLVTLEHKTAGELTAAEKNIIKSRLEIAFWKADEAPSFICSFHRGKLLGDSNMQSCSVCHKRRSKKVEVYIITYRMAVEFYMTNGQFLAIGQLACSGCKAKSLKGLDFSNSRTIVPDPSSSSLTTGDLAGPIKKGAEEEIDINPEETPVQRQMLIREISVHRDVVLPASTSAQGKLAPIQPIQPLPQRPQAKVVAKSSLKLASPSQTTEKNNSEGGKSRQDLHDALTNSLTDLNPDFQPLGFTINSLSSCSAGVLSDALRAGQAAISTILTSIAPGQEAELWNIVKPELDKLYPASSSQEQSGEKADLQSEQSK